MAPSSRLARPGRQAEITFFFPGENVCLVRGMLITSYLSKHFIAQIWPMCVLVPYGQQAVDVRTIGPAASDRLQKVDCRRKTYSNQRGNNFHTVHLSLSLCVLQGPHCMSFFLLLLSIFQTNLSSAPAGCLGAHSTQ